MECETVSKSPVDKEFWKCGCENHPIHHHSENWCTECGEDQDKCQNVPSSEIQRESFANLADAMESKSMYGIRELLIECQVVSKYSQRAFDVLYASAIGVTASTDEKGGMI